jgi:YidC/Oxa1 family membrane protein insertase
MRCRLLKRMVYCAAPGWQCVASRVATLGTQADSIQYRPVKIHEEVMFTSANVRLFLWALLFVALFVNYQAWQIDHPAPLAVVNATAPQSLDGGAPTAIAPVSAVPGAAVPGMPLTGVATPGAATPTTAVTTAVPAAADDAVAVANASAVHVVTDVLDMDVSLAGGELRRADLVAYPVAKGRAQPVRLLNRDSDAARFVLQSGLAGTDGGPAPTHQALFKSAVTEVTLAPGQDEIKLPLTWTNDAGVTVTKTYTFKRGGYQIDVDYLVQNASAMPWGFASYAQLLRSNQPIETSYFKPETYSFKGPAYYDGAKYEKLTMGSKEASIDRAIKGGWLAGMQHHFVAAIVPNKEFAYQYRLRTQGEEFLFSATSATQSVASGAQARQTEVLFVGPKLQQQLTIAGPDLFRVADYGMLTIIAQPLFSLLEWVHALVGNWGYTIVIATFLLKLLFYPLSEASGRSMAKMKLLAPRIKALQETYKDQRDKLAKATMEMYQKEKVNPLAGCLPMIIQIPVFLAFYWVLLESVEMRQAPFIGWINDLSVRDPWFILPVIMAVASFIQFKLNPQMGTDPMQQKIFMMMPIVMSVTFAFFPAGLVLYWVTNTVLSIAQQWNINRRIETAAAKARR